MLTVRVVYGVCDTGEEIEEPCAYCLTSYACLLSFSGAVHCL